MERTSPPGALRRTTSMFTVHVRPAGSDGRDRKDRHHRSNHGQRVLKPDPACRHLPAGVPSWMVLVVFQAFPSQEGPNAPITLPSRSVSSPVTRAEVIQIMIIYLNEDDDKTYAQQQQQQLDSQLPRWIHETGNGKLPTCGGPQCTVRCVSGIPWLTVHCVLYPGSGPLFPAPCPLSCICRAVCPLSRSFPGALGRPHQQNALFTPAVTPQPEPEPEPEPVIVPSDLDTSLPRDHSRQQQPRPRLSWH